MSKIIWFVVIFLLVGGFIIKSAYDINFSDDQDKSFFLGKFSGWIFDLGKNVIGVTGYAIKQDWLPKNETNNQTIFLVDIP